MTARIMRFDGAGPADLHASIVGDLMAYMGRRRISQRRLATLIGVDQSTVSRWFNKDMSVADLDRVLMALGLNGKLDFLDAETGTLTPPKVSPYLSAIPGEGSKSGPSRTPLLMPVGST